VKHLSGAPLKGRLPFSSTNIRLGWKGLTRTNTYTKYVNYGGKKLYSTGPCKYSASDVYFNAYIPVV
jgi:hypothetical protein